MVGLAQGAFDKAVPYTYQRSQFGQPIGTFQGMQFQIAQAAVDIETARLLTYNAARRKDEGKDFTKAAAMAKYWASVVAQRVSGGAIEWAGGVGFTRETGIEKYWRDSKIVGCRYLVNSHRLTVCQTTGSNLRGNIQYSTPNDRQAHPKGVLVVLTSRLAVDTKDDAHITMHCTLSRIYYHDGSHYQNYVFL